MNLFQKLCRLAGFAGLLPFGAWLASITDHREADQMRAR